MELFFEHQSHVYRDTPCIYLTIGTCSIADGSSGLELPHGQSPPDLALALSVPKTGKEFEIDVLLVKKYYNLKYLILVF